MNASQTVSYSVLDIRVCETLKSGITEYIKLSSYSERRAEGRQGGEGGQKYRWNGMRVLTLYQILKATSVKNRMGSSRENYATRRPRRRRR